MNWDGLLFQLNCAVRLGIGEKDALEIYVDGERIMLKKYEPACIFCGNAENVTYFKGKIVCNVCLSEMPTPVTK